MNILYIGHYKENSGWSKAAIDLISSIDSVGINIVCRNIKLTPQESNVSNRILELEKRPIKNIDVCIQHVLPHHLTGTSKFKNISYYVGESNTLKYNNWKCNLKLMDEIWVPNRTALNNMNRDGFDNVRYVPHAFDLSQYKKTETKKISFGDKNHTFKFYYIADINERKNLESVIKCFHSEFHRSEPVSLVLKVKKFGVSPDDLNSYVKNLCNSIKTTLRIYPKVENYHEEIIIPNNMSENEIQLLHRSCDCFVNPTHGEGWSIPSFEAMCFGKTPICGNEGGPKEYIKDKNSGTLINGVLGVCEHSDPPAENLGLFQMKKKSNQL